MKKKFQREHKHIRTKEDWYPTLRPNQKSPNPRPQFNNPLDHPAVCVSLLRLTDGKYRVCVWGGDDYGLEFDTPDLTEARKLYRSIDDFTTQRELVLAGMVTA